ncbi:sporulation/spore germination protein [Romeria aff. gracilis LEGE 07310]|uniref:Sporulation/spore germination protein n=1 Tax=Vasconcelosia minhoensis LEGE 07310 TaxID=915328 RepID=A0A8J7AQD2_9CYAN|nr:sporulation/spore germination protein [Romeria gracilis]MBE9078699.1 sporulation/spore germination protein [Romeria aff. gracilis LEGE 07310]
MKRLPKTIFGLALGLMLVTSCATSPPVAEPEPKPAETEQAEVPADSKAPAAEADKPTAAEPDAAVEPESSEEMTTVSIYVMDDMCNELVSETVQVERDQALSQAVGKVLAEQDYNAFKISGYRVNIDPGSGIAVVDLRLAPESQRKFVSLSSCEQRSLFGSLEETLLQNPDWQVNSVKFTERGEEIVL